ncbi:hypothetical protein H6781_02825 [Candidatus Nomurabacteria bacterium]|nr:hypothetical protein [Candidatus Kaiserbacteria bacterium]MCB9810502.1 hypothetical protein [Candidatus Nomurabacteria bacterium]MCB9818179.1 hypothetical protein [Candidatus Nomurabacteria bacterium]
MNTVHESELEYFVDRDRATCHKCGGVEPSVFPANDMCQKEYNRIQAEWNDWVFFARRNFFHQLISVSCLSILTSGVGTYLIACQDYSSILELPIICFLYVVVALVAAAFINYYRSLYDKKIEKLKAEFSCGSRADNVIDRIKLELGH